MRTRYYLYKSLLPIFAIACLVSACAPAINWDYPRNPSNTFAQPETTTVGALFQEAADKHPGLSGFSMIRQGGHAFMARLAMADLAEKTLDAQYYIWDGDTTGLILADHLLRAADRGVRVRVLIDDHYMIGKQRQQHCGARRPSQHRDPFLQPGQEPALAHDELVGRVWPRQPPDAQQAVRYGQRRGNCRRTQHRGCLFWREYRP